MVNLPANYILDQIRGLRGKPRITHPGENTDIVRLEYVTTLPKDKWKLEPLTASPDNETALLVGQQVIKQDGQYVEVYRVYETLPGQPLKTKTLGSVNAIPQEFLAKKGFTITSQPVTADTEPAELTGNVVESNVQQESVARATLTKTEVDLSGTVTITDQVLTSDGQLATRTRKLGNEGQEITPSATLLSAEEQALGNGKSVLTTLEVDEVFAEKRYSKERQEVVPPEFRTDLTYTTESEVVEGEAEMPSLGSGDRSASEEQLTVQKKRISRTSLSGGTTTTRTGEVLVTQFGGGVATVTRTFTTEPSGSIPSPSVGTISSEAKPVPGGTITETVSISDLPELEGQIYDEELGVTIPFTQQTIAAGTLPSGADVNPVDFLRSVRRTTDVSAAQSNLESIMLSYATKQQVRLPNKLISASMVWSPGRGDGRAQQFNARRRSSFTSGSSCEASIVGDLALEIEPGYNGLVDATVYVFFLKNDSVNKAAILSKTGASDWPVIKERSHTLVIRGGSSSKRISTNVLTDDWSLLIASRDEDTQERRRVHTVTIPPTIHRTISIANPTSPVVTASAQAFMSTANASVQGSISPSTLSATSPSTFPTGDFLYSMSVSPFRYGMARVTALVVHIGNEHV